MFNFKSSEVDKSYLIHLAWVWRGTVYLRLKRFYLMSFRNESQLEAGSSIASVCYESEPENFLDETFVEFLDALLRCLVLRRWILLIPSNLCVI